MSDSSSNTAFRAPELAELAPLFPGYEFEMLIATGGMGAVYRAVQKSLDRIVAIKILPREFSSDAAFCAGFEAEAKAMARLNHLNLVGVYDFGEVNGMPFIIMEYIAGKSLFHSANGNAIDPSEVIRLVAGICEGLAHAHENGILHRDIKPSNILLDSNAQPKIGDFGLARPIETKIQEGEEIFGTPHYTAPEVVDSPNSVDYRADIFSVGVLLHELLTGRLPANDPRPASAISHCDPRFDAIIRRATHPNPDGRYTSALEIAHDLQTIATTAGPRVLRTAAPSNSRRPSRPVATSRQLSKSQSSGSPFFIIILIAFIVGTIAYLTLYSPKNDQPDLTTPATPKPQLKPLPNTNPHHPERELQPKQKRKKQQQRPQEKQQLENQPQEEPEQVLQEQTPDQPQEPETDLTSSTEPKFDVPSFLKRALSIMNGLTSSSMADRDKKFFRSLENFEQSAIREIRKIRDKTEQNDIKDSLEIYISNCKTAKNYLPEKFKTESLLSDVSDVSDIHEEFIEEQNRVDEALVTSLASFSPTYILGIQKQIERLQPTGDTAAIALLEEEIAATRADAAHLPNLLLGIQPKPDNL